jgi:micrococcal nuclease
MTKRQKKKLLRAVLALVVFLIGALSAHLQNNPASVPVALQAGFYQVTQFDDGDTVIVDMGGVEEKVRFIGVDTPETKDPRKPIQCFGKAASAFTKNLIGDQPVKLESDPTNTNRDRYGRLLRYVYLPDGTFVNLEIIKQGYGFAYVSFPVQKLEEFKAAQVEARTNNRGLWAGCKPVENQYGGFTSNDEGR